MLNCDTLIRNANVLDGSGNKTQQCDVAVRDGRIVEIGESLKHGAEQIIEGEGLWLAPGFIDVHTHDDTSVIETPEMLPKISQGVTTVIVGNCGISASPVRLKGDPPDPMNLLGSATFSATRSFPITLRRWSRPVPQSTLLRSLATLHSATITWIVSTAAPRLKKLRQCAQS